MRKAFPLTSSHLCGIYVLALIFLPSSEIGFPSAHSQCKAFRLVYSTAGYKKNAEAAPMYLPTGDFPSFDLTKG